MSFSSDAKAELCREETASKSLAAAECYGVLLFANTFRTDEIRIVTESRPFAQRLSKLFRRAFGAYPEGTDAPEGSKMNLTVTDRAVLDRVLSAFGYEKGKAIVHHINYGVLEEDTARRAFLRGAFLAGGSVTDPRKRYHLELVTSHYGVSREIVSLLLDMSLQPKSAARSGNYVTYFKQSQSIADFLTTIGAQHAALEVMSAAVEKEMQNSINRMVNCDTANVTKTVNAAQEQLDAIKKIQQTVGLEALPDKLQETALIRVMNPELSISQLAELTVPPVSKSCISHRLRKIQEFSRTAE